ncbi:MAG: cryptochrome/photolyase family protein [Flavobacteriaceae bacterium]
MEENFSVFWFRRDLRLVDNLGLNAALSSGLKVIPIFIFDTEIINKLEKNDLRIKMIHAALVKLNDAMLGNRCNVGMYLGNPKAVFESLIKNYKIKSVFTNRDYEPYAIKRDKSIKSFLEKKNVTFKSFKDQVIFEKDEVVKDDGNPYKVYTPYSRKWIEKLNFIGFETCASELKLNSLANISLPHLSLKEIGFDEKQFDIPMFNIDSKRIEKYQETRNFPYLNSTSRIGAHLRFGFISIRKLVQKALINTNKTYLKELIWREFFMQILWHFPYTKEKSFKPKYDNIRWINNNDEFQKWCEGNTGYPLVDAGMRELNQTGFMHNRVRMLVGSFLCKHLLIDWRWGEKYFAKKLLDYEMSSNVGNWQWVAGCGVDASPYFRIFNPKEQIKKFDKDFRYIKKWVPDFESSSYPKEIIDHKFARRRCLETFKAAVA